MTCAKTLVALGALGLAACSSSYTPRPSPRIALVQESGGLALHKNGASQDVGPFGGGLVKAVEGNAQASKHASTFRGRTIAGFILNLVGGVGMGAGTAMFIYNETDDRGPDDGLRAASLGVLLGSFAVSLTGSIFMASAQPHFFDAINVYNDSVDGYAPPPPYGPPPYGPPPAWGAPPAAAPVYPPAPMAPPPIAPVAPPGPPEPPPPDPNGPPSDDALPPPPDPAVEGVPEPVAPDP